MLSQPRAIRRPTWLPQRGSAATQCWLQSHPLTISRTGDSGMKYQIYQWSFFISYRTDSTTVESPLKFTPFWWNWVKYTGEGGLVQITHMIKVKTIQKRRDARNRNMRRKHAIKPSHRGRKTISCYFSLAECSFHWLVTDQKHNEEIIEDIYL